MAGSVQIRKRKRLRNVRIKCDVVHLKSGLIRIFIFQDDLDKVAAVWNRHRIRSSNRGLPSGRPCVMYEVPIIYNTHSYLVPITEQELRVHRDRCTFRKAIPCDEDVFKLSCSLLAASNQFLPKSADEAKDLYLKLQMEARQLLQV